MNTELDRLTAEEKARKAKLKSTICTAAIVSITILTMVVGYKVKMSSLKSVDKAAIIEEVLKTYNPDGTLK